MAMPIVQDSVDAFPLLVEHAGDISVVEFLRALQEIEEIFVKGKTRVLQSGEHGSLPEFEVQSGQPFRVIFGGHLAEHIPSGHQGANQPLARIAKREFLHAHGDGRGADGVLDLTEFVVRKPKRRQQIPSMKTTAPDVNCGVFRPGATDVIPAFQVTGVVEDRRSDRQFPVTLLESRNDRLLPVGSQQVGDRRRRLHRVIKIVERCIARLEIRIFTMEQVERKGDQRIAKACFWFAESFSQNPINEFGRGEITLGMKHLIGC